MRWYSLRIAGVKDSTIRGLFKKFKKYDDIFNLDKVYLKQYCKISDEEIEKIYLSRNIDLQKELKILENKGIKILSFADNEYPEELRNIATPPIFLFYQGDISLLNGERLGVVGTRKTTSYGRVCCEKIVGELVDAGVTIVSGLALGIDALSHKKTLEKDGKTIAVVGSGLDVIYPSENRELWEKIVKNGLLISEFPLGTKPNSYNFPMRNRIIVGLSKGVLVVESQKTGGSLITAELALEEGREVFAIPGDIFSPSSEGTNNLIKNSQAKLVLNAKDILIEFGWDNINTIKKERENLNLSKLEKIIYDTLNKEKSLDEIIMESKLKVGEALSILMELEAKKIVMSVAGGKYRRKI